MINKFLRPSEKRIRRNRLNEYYSCLIGGIGLPGFGRGNRLILGLKLPGSIVGMVLLFAALQAGWVKLSWVGELADILMANLTLFLVPPACRHQLFGRDCKRLVFNFDGHNRQYDLRIIGDRQSA